MGLEEKKRRLIESLKMEGMLRSPEVIEAMMKVPREEFVLPFYRKEAYNDYPLPVEGGQTISAPHMVAMMTELLDLKRGQRVLDIGTGTGYHAAVMAEIVGPEGRVYGVERVKDLAERATETLTRLGYGNVEIYHGDGSVGLEDKAPFDRILVACAAPDVPEPLIRQLRDGGKMVIPVGYGTQTLMLVEKSGDKIRKERHGECVFVPMIGKHGFRR